VKRNVNLRNGFTLVELMLAMGVFLIICAAMFSLLQLSQQRYASETQMSGSFQEARLAVDQIARDVNDAGFPSRGVFSKQPNSWSYAVGPIAWDPGYPSTLTLCSIGTAGGGTCTTPGDFDLIVETMLQTGTAGAMVPTVSWIRYQLKAGDTTLYRGVAAKVSGTDPISATSVAGVMVPFLTNVMNNAPGTQLAQITAAYPTMFPGGIPVPIFQYSCDTPSGTQACPNAGTYNSPQNIRDVDITLIVMTPTPDSQTQQIKLIELNGRGHRLNPVN
jgi:prepilin-type N-terminal cleavage/methylation domain-containing protein